ncbi:MAG: helicase HerA domain-containing protein, partial [Anaerolineae bacterium]
MQAPPERLGSFYLGAEYDLENGQRTQNPINYDARDLTTHAVCVGMTGSGKTGLCIGLLEEAAIDKVPTILIDPKGDMTNLLLQFPELRPEDFEPWINPDDARRKGKTIAEFAGATADLWRNGLAGWGIGPDRIRLLQESADFTIYTPGSDAGLPISILSSLAAPDLDFEQHAEAIRERIGGTVVALLGLVGIEADPIRSREAILLSTVFEHFWRKREDLDLAKLIMSIQTPPVRQLGVFDVDTFYPEKERFELAMAFNNLMASPGFQSWLQGEALEVDRLLYTAEGKPRHSIFYIAHLSDSERMFFVTLLLENIVTWMRGQTGTTSLRALLYFDEVFGFFPPTAEPPSKRPLLTLLKQARAFGLGTILVTQNPVDLDYKGLTNAGTWFIGKLQAERDKDRVLQGLKGAIAEAGGGQQKVDYDALIGQLGSRVFLMHNVHEDRPVVFHTRWVMSYLRGPLTRPQVRKLMAGRAPAAAPPPAKPRRATPRPAAAAPEPAAETPAAPAGFSPNPPALDPSLPQVFLPVELSEQAAVRQAAQELGRQLDVERVQLVYEPALLGGATVRFVDRKRQIDEKVEKILLGPAPGELSGVDWDEAETLPLRLGDLASGPERVGAEEGPFFAPVPEAANSPRELKSIGKDLSDWLYYNSRLALTAHAELGLLQRPGERERDFKIRLQQAARERRDDEVDALERKYEKQIDRLEARLRKEERELAADEAEYQARKQQELIGIGESVVGFFLGRRSTRALSRAASKRRMTSRARLEIEESQEEIAALEEEIAALEDEMKEAADEITRKWADLLEDLTVEELKPRRTDVDVRLAALAWQPFWLITYN